MLARKYAMFKWGFGDIVVRSNKYKFRIYVGVFGGELLIDSPGFEMNLSSTLCLLQETGF